MEKWFSVLSGEGDNHAVCNVSLGGAVAAILIAASFMIVVAGEPPAR